MTNEEIKYDTQFKPFQRVLVRDDNDDIWRAQLFSHYQTTTMAGYYYVTGLGAFKQCIPYEGNEYLCDTIKKPNSVPEPTKEQLVKALKLLEKYEDYAGYTEEINAEVILEHWNDE